MFGNKIKGRVIIWAEQQEEGRLRICARVKAKSGEVLLHMVGSIIISVAEDIGVDPMEMARRAVEKVTKGREKKEAQG